MVGNLHKESERPFIDFLAFVQHKTRLYPKKLGKLVTSHDIRLELSVFWIGVQHSDEPISIAL
jgi:hypothetical protein